MSVPSTSEKLRAEADLARKNKEYEKACDLYSSLIEHENKDTDAYLTNVLCRDFIHYAECLMFSQKPGQPINDEDMEIAWECLEKARISYEAMSESKDKVIGLIDVHDILGEITMRNGNFAVSAQEFKKSSEIGLAHPELSWRLPLNSLYCQSLSLTYSAKLEEARNVQTAALNFIDTQLSKDLPDADKADLAAFRTEISAARDKLVAIQQAAETQT